MLTQDTITSVSPDAETVALEQQILEEDLDLQLAMLKNEMLPDNLKFLDNEEASPQETMEKVADLPSFDDVARLFKDFTPHKVMKHFELDEMMSEFRGKSEEAFSNLEENKAFQNVREKSKKVIDNLGENKVFDSVRETSKDFMKGFAENEFYADVRKKANALVSNEAKDGTIEEPSFQSFLEQGKKYLITDESGISEEVMLCVAVLCVLIIPSILHH